jgi:hypothetical protein
LTVGIRGHHGKIHHRDKAARRRAFFDNLLPGLRAGEGDVLVGFGPETPVDTGLNHGI